IPEPAPEQTPLSRLRASAQALSFLQNDTTERQALLKAAGISFDMVSPYIFADMANNLLEVVDTMQAEEEVWPVWCRYSSPEQDGKDRRQDGLNTRRLSDVIPRPVEWLWPQRIPLGKLTMLSGD